MKKECEISPLDFIPQLHLEPIVVPPRKRPRKRKSRSLAHPEEPPDLQEDFRIDETMQRYKPKKKHE